MKPYLTSITSSDRAHLLVEGLEDRVVPAFSMNLGLSAVAPIIGSASASASTSASPGAGHVLQNIGDRAAAILNDLSGTLTNVAGKVEGLAGNQLAAALGTVQHAL